MNALFSVLNHCMRSIAIRTALACLLAGVVFSSACNRQSNASAKAAISAVPVQVTTALARDVPIYGDWVATLDGSVNAQIQPQVSGYLVRQLYREGTVVHRGQVLFEIDPRTFQAALNQAKAQLAEARSRLAIAEVNVRRDTPLVQEHAIAQSQLDTEIATVTQARASVQSSQAAVETAQLNLGFTKVRSLVDGIAGIATAQIGNLVSPTTVLTAVSKVDPIKVYFPISEQEYLRMANKLRGTHKDMKLALTLANGSNYPYPGEVIFTDRQVDSQTGTIRLVGTFPNPNGLLRPGQFGRVRALIDVRQGAVLVPQRAVAELQGIQQLVVVKPGNVVSFRKVKMGQRVGDLWVVENGVAAGEPVVTEGLLKLRADGQPVTIVAHATEGK